MDKLITQRLDTLSLTSLLEVQSTPCDVIGEYCRQKQIEHVVCTYQTYQEQQRRFDIAIVHHVEPIPPHDLYPCLGLLKNLLSERVWLLTPADYGSPQEWISLGFKQDALKVGEHGDVVSYSYNLDTYNHKREWNNTRFWANPEHWDKRF